MGAGPEWGLAAGHAAPDLCPAPSQAGCPLASRNYPQPLTPSRAVAGPRAGRGCGVQRRSQTPLLATPAKHWHRAGLLGRVTDPQQSESGASSSAFSGKEN